MKTINQSQLVSLLSAVKGTSFVQLTYVGEQKMRKTNNPFDTIIKRTNINVSFNYSYENAVNNRLAKKGEEKTFVSEPLAWGSWLIPNKIITHKECLYVRFYMHSNCNSKVEHFYNGEKLEGADLEQAKTFFQEHSESAKQTEAGLDQKEQCKPFNVKIENIRKITLNGTQYELV
jgi:hypothetical protein